MKTAQIAPNHLEYQANAEKGNTHPIVDKV
jgi:hypothetical protein